MRISLDGSDWLCKDYIGEDWLWRGAHRPGTRDGHGWRPATVPGSIQYDLWQSGAIPDPYFERNSLLIEWVPQRTWVFRKTFNLPGELQGRRIELRFEGVDYEAQFFLNGELLGRHTGMYTPAVFSVADRLKFDQENLLAVVVEPAPHEQPQVGRSSQVRTHKSRMGYWWDFCPRVVHLGVWDSVLLEVTGPAKIEEVFVRPQLSEDRRRADVSISLELSAGRSLEVEVEASLSQAGQIAAVRRSRVAVEDGQARLVISLEVDRPRLWWPNGYGEPALYKAEVRLTLPDQASEESDRRQVPFGIRRIAFTPNQTPDPAARPYTLVVNDRRVYIKGWNWVPVDALYGVQRPAKLRRLLGLARRANVNLLRVWGGGLIEKEVFYDLCDRLGILVWQEFIQSSSGIDNNPPEDPEFIRFMVQEVRQIIPRKRNHPSLAIWCGGNELQNEQDQPLDERHPMLAALQSVVQELDPDRLWLPTSPTGRVFGNTLENIARDPTGLHDVHGPWEHQGLERHQLLYNQGTSLLHSEFGVEGITNLKTLDRVISKQNQLPVSLDNPVWFHLGSWWVKQASWRATFGKIDDLERLVLATQFLQADGLRYAVEADRRRKYQNSGTLPWQFNEPYPMAACTSAVDYYAHPKPVYYAVAEAYAPVHISAKFPLQAWGDREQFEAEVWVSNSLEHGFEDVQLQMAILGASGRSYTVYRATASFKPDASTRLAAINWPLAGLEEEVFFLDLRLSQADGGVLSNTRYIFSRTQDLAPLLAVQGTGLEVSRGEMEDCWEVGLKNPGENTALFVWLQEEPGHRSVSSKDDPRSTSTAGDPTGYAYFSENYFCLLPGESRQVSVEWDRIPPGSRSLRISGWNIETQVITG